MATSKVRIISNALIQLLEEPINYLDLENKRHVAANSLYEMILPDMLSKFGWDFSLKNRDLQRLVDVPNNSDKWAYSFQLPQDPELIMLYGIYPDSDYAIYGNRLLSNQSELKADYIFQNSESYFPPFFERLMVDEMTAVLAMPITQNAVKAEYWRKIADRQRMEAQQICAQQTGSYIIDPNDSITASHHV